MVSSCTWLMAVDGQKQMHQPATDGQVAGCWWPETDGQEQTQEHQPSVAQSLLVQPRQVVCKWALLTAVAGRQMGHSR